VVAQARARWYSGVLASALCYVDVMARALPYFGIVASALEGDGTGSLISVALWCSVSAGLDPESGGSPSTNSHNKRRKPFESRIC